VKPMGTVRPGKPVWSGIFWLLSSAGLSRSPNSLGGLLHVG
jgi:hypothetical protein